MIRNKPQTSSRLLDQMNGSDGTFLSYYDQKESVSLRNSISEQINKLVAPDIYVAGKKLACFCLRHAPHICFVMPIDMDPIF